MILVVGALICFLGLAYVEFSNFRAVKEVEVNIYGRTYCSKKPPIYLENSIIITDCKTGEKKRIYIVEGKSPNPY